jgi:outer membrane protein
MTSERVITAANSTLSWDNNSKAGKFGIEFDMPYYEFHHKSIFKTLLMKRCFIILAGLLLPLGMAVAQKYAFVDTEYILNNIPTYKAAQEQLDKFSADWQKEVEAKYTDIEKMYKDYQAERVLLSEDMRRQREEAIVNKEKEAKELQKTYFGQDGALFKKRQELIQPIQDDIYKAIKDLATENGYAVIFDTSSGPSMIYTNPRYDVSDEVLQKLGYKN